MRAPRLNRALVRGRVRAFEHEDRLAELVEGEFDKAGKRAASRFSKKATDHLTASASGVTSASTMVCLYPTPEQAVALAQPNGEPAEVIHLTLAYLGETDPDVAEHAVAVIRDVAAQHGPLEGVVGGIAAFGGVDARPVVAQIVKVAERHAPAGGYGDTAWNADTATVYWVSADWSSNDEMDAAERDFLAIDGVDAVEHDAETNAPSGDGWEIVWTPTVERLYPSIVLPDVPGLPELRQAVTDALTASGLDYAQHHGFTPHMTIAYGPEPTPPSRALLGLPLNFDRLSVARGDVPRDFPLGQALTAAATPKWTPPHADEIFDVDAFVKTLRTKSDPVRRAAIAALMTDALKQAGLDFDVTNAFVDRVLAQSASQVTNIAETTRLNLMRTIRSAYEEGLTIPDTAKAIRAGMKDASTVRARLIARTELAAVANGGAVATAQQIAEFTGDAYLKRWLTAPGAEWPRHEDYEGLDGQTVELDDSFDVGGFDLEFPGDPGGPPGEVCNCRCTVVMVEAKDAQITPSESPLPVEPDFAGGFPNGDIPPDGTFAGFIGPKPPAAGKLTKMLADLPVDEPKDFGLATIEKSKREAEQDLYLIRWFDERHPDLGSHEYHLYNADDAAQFLKLHIIDPENEGRGEPLLDVGRGMNAGKQFARYDKFLRSLSYVERDAFARYTGDEYEELGAYFRVWPSLEMHGLGLDPDQTRVLMRMQRVMDRAPKLSVKELWHGEQPSEAFEKIKLGDDIQLAGGNFASTTPEATVATDFGPVLFRITGDVRGIPLAPLSEVPSESEYLLPRDARFRVTRVSQQMVRSRAFGETDVMVFDVKPIPKEELPPPQTPEDYRIAHRSPDAESGAPMSDVTANGIYPDDFYGLSLEERVRIYGGGGDATDDKRDLFTFDRVRRVYGNPSAEVTIYRAVPGDVNEINPGDWVTPSRSYAKLNVDMEEGKGWHVISKKVRAGDLYTSGDSIQEWGWQPNVAPITKPSAPSLTRDAAFGIYSRSPDAINEVLQGDFSRYNRKTIATLDGRATIGDVIDAMDAGFDQSTAPVGIETWRGLRDLSSLYKVTRPEDLVGKTFTERGYIPTTTVREVAEKAANGPDAFANITGVSSEADRQIVRDALENIRSLHELPKGMFAVKYQSDPLVDGASYAARERVVRVEDALASGRYGDVAESSVVHETGHAIDDFLSGDLEWYASEMKIPPSGVKEVMDAIYKSEAYPRFQKIANPGPGRPVGYAALPREMFARAYEQWVTVRTGDERLLADLQARLDVPQEAAYYWHGNDFEPVARALDQLFGPRPERVQDLVHDGVVVRLHVPPGVGVMSTRLAPVGALNEEYVLLDRDLRVTFTGYSNGVLDARVEGAGLVAGEKPIESYAAEIGITPFRAVEDNKIGFYDSDKFKRFTNDIDAAADQFGVIVDTTDRVAGIWEGDTEPSVALRVHDGELGVRAYAADLARAYDQDGVLLFGFNKTGTDISATFNDVRPHDEVFRAMRKVGLYGGRFTAEGRLQIVGQGNEDFVKKLHRLSEIIGTSYDADVGTFALLDKETGDYDKAIRAFADAERKSVVSRGPLDGPLDSSVAAPGQVTQGREAFAAARLDEHSPVVTEVAEANAEIVADVDKWLLPFAREHQAAVLERPPVQRADVTEALRAHLDVNPLLAPADLAELYTPTYQLKVPSADAKRVISLLKIATIERGRWFIGELPVPEHRARFRVLLNRDRPGGRLRFYVELNDQDTVDEHEIRDLVDHMKQKPNGQQQQQAPDIGLITTEAADRQTESPRTLSARLDESPTTRVLAYVALPAADATHKTVGLLRVIVDSGRTYVERAVSGGGWVRDNSQSTFRRLSDGERVKQWYAAAAYDAMKA